MNDMQTLYKGTKSEVFNQKPNIMKRTYYLVLLVLSMGALAHGQSGREGKVATAVDELTKAMLHPDSGSLERLISEDVSYGHSSGLVQDKSEIIEGLTNGPFHFLTIDISDQTINAINDIAIVRQVLSTDYSDNGEKGTHKFGVLLVWHLEKGAWKLLARQAIKL